MIKQGSLQKRKINEIEDKIRSIKNALPKLARHSKVITKHMAKNWNYYDQVAQTHFE